MSGCLNGVRGQIIANAVNARLLTDNEEAKYLVSELLSYQTKGQNGSWTGRDTFFRYSDGFFPAGFVFSVGKMLRDQGMSLQFAMKQAPAPLGPEIGTVDPMGWGFSDRYDYQPETVRRLLRLKRMIARVATGGGKSRIAILTHFTIGGNTLFLTTRSDLMYQMKRSFEEHGFNVGVVGDSVFEPKKGVNVAMVQTLASMLRDGGKREERAKKFLSLMTTLIGEEAHEVGGDGYYLVASHCINAHYRVALTATPFMKGDEEANMRLQAVFGSIGIEVTEELLINRGILAKPYFKYVDSPVPSTLRRNTGYAAAYEIGITENEARHAINCREALNMKSRGLPTIALIQRVKHGHQLNKMFTNNGLRTAFLSGKDENRLRKQALDDLSAGNLDVVIGSTIFDVGVDVPSVGMIQLAGGGKDQVSLRQRIGRGLREKKTGDNVCFILDHQDQGNKHLKEHYLTRRAIVEATPGFCEGILLPGRDFPL